MIGCRHFKASPFTAWSLTLAVLLLALAAGFVVLASWALPVTGPGASSEEGPYFGLIVGLSLVVFGLLPFIGGAAGMVLLVGAGKNGERSRRLRLAGWVVNGLLLSLGSAVILFFALAIQ